MDDPDQRLTSWEGKVILALGGIACTLAGVWLQNIWASQQQVTAAFQSFQQSISQTYVTKDNIAVITSARERQIQAIVDRIDQMTLQIVRGEERAVQMLQTIAKMENDITSIKERMNGDTFKGEGRGK